MIPGLLFPLVLYNLRSNKRFLASCGILLAASVFWSPFVALGLLPLMVALLVDNGPRPFMRWQNIVPVLPVLLLIVAYLSFGSIEYPSGWVWDRYGWEGIVFAPEFVGLLMLFVYAALAVLIHPDLRRDSFFVACCLAILILPWYSFGLHDEYPKYTAFVPLLILCLFCSRCVLGEWRALVRLRQRVSLLALALLLIVGLGNPLAALLRVNPMDVLANVRFENLDSQLTSVLDATRSQYHDQYAMIEVPEWYQLLLRNPEVPILERGELIIEADYTVYLSGKQLIYVQESCAEAESDTRFFLFVRPVDSALIAGNEHDNRDFLFEWNGSRIGGMCVATRSLPNYEVESFTTGQYIGKSAPTGEMWIATYHMR